MQEEKRNILTGILGTVAFHLLVLVVFLTLKIGEVKTKHEELISLEISEEVYKSIEEIIEANKPVQEEITPLNQQVMSNIASNVADKINEEINTDKYVEDVMKELGMEEINPHYDNTLPDDPSLSSDQKEEEKEELNTNFGQTRITYNVPPNRKARHIDRPIYRCQGGGTVVVSIIVDPNGNVIQASLIESSTKEECIKETAIASAQNFYFERDKTAEKRVQGTITYIFVAQ